MTFEAILSRMLERVPLERDKRTGSVIYDTLAPTAAELANMNIIMEIFREQMSLETATGDALDVIGRNFAMERRAATYAVRYGEFKDNSDVPMDVPVGSRFSVPNVVGNTTYIVIESVTTGTMLLQCELAGEVGNEHFGQILPLQTINNLGTATLTGTYRSGEDTETDGQYRARIIERINRQAFGGNVAAYRLFTTAIEGVGDVKVFPIWDGGGTVKISIIDGQYMPVDALFIDHVQTIIDPIPNNGLGLGVAPIGHRVTVVTPDELEIDIEANVYLTGEYALTQLQELIERAISEYLYDIRRTWALSDTVYVFVSRIISAMMSVQGVLNVTDLTINGLTSDLAIPQDELVQKVPILGQVILHDS